MFTGLVEEIGRIVAVDGRTADGQEEIVKITIASKVCLVDAALGDSISVNGCCLTVIEKSSETFVFEAVQETLQRTNLGDFTKDTPVNLERAMKPSDRLGGHFVTGHIDGLGAITEIENHDEWQKIWVQVPTTLSLQMASKGSVALDGISLTLVDVEPESFSIAVIPHTLQMTTLGTRQVGDQVNIETDLLAKYVQRQLDSHSLS